MAANRTELLEKIGKTSFVMDETRLFLDTHPCNQEALALYKDTAVKREALVNEYTECFGPLAFYNTFEGSEWKWAETPWPWEGWC